MDHASKVAAWLGAEELGFPFGIGKAASIG